MVARASRSSIGLLETSSGTFTTELLGFAAARIGDEKGLVVLNEQRLKLAFSRLVIILLGKGNNGLGNRLANGKDLGEGTTSSDAHSDVKVLEAFLAQQEDGLEHLHSQRGRLHNAE